MVVARLGANFVARHGGDDVRRPLPAAAQKKDGRTERKVGHLTMALPSVVVVRAALLVVELLAPPATVSSLRQKVGTKKNGSGCFVSCATFGRKREPAPLKNSKILSCPNGAEYRD